MEFLLDHIVSGPVYFIDPDVETYDAIYPGDPEEIKSMILFSYQVFAVKFKISTSEQEEIWNKDGTGLLGSKFVVLY